MPTNLIPMVDGFQNIAELCQNNDQGVATKYMSVIDRLHQRPEARTTIHQKRTMTPQPHAVANQCRRHQRNSKTTSDKLSPSSSRFKSGQHLFGTRQIHDRDLWTSHQGEQPWGDSATWNVVDDQMVEMSRTLHAVRPMCGLIRHTGSAISDVKSSLHRGDWSNER